MEYKDKLNLLSVTELRKFIKDYNLQMKIVMTRKKKDELITEILKHTKLENGKVSIISHNIEGNIEPKPKAIKERKPKAIKEKVPKVEVKKSNKQFLKIPDIIRNYVLKFDNISGINTREDIKVLNKDLGIEGFKFEDIFSEIMKFRDEIYAEDVNDKVNNLFDELIALIEKKGNKKEIIKEGNKKEIIKEENLEDKIKNYALEIKKINEELSKNNEKYSPIIIERMKAVTKERQSKGEKMNQGKVNRIRENLIKTEFKEYANKRDSLYDAGKKITKEVETLLDNVETKDMKKELISIYQTFKK